MPQTVLADIGSVWSTKNHLYADPGSGGTVQQNNVAYGLLKVASGTRVLPDDGLPIFVQSTSSTVTVNSVAAATVGTVAAGDIKLFLPVTSTTWTVFQGNASAVAIADAGAFTLNGDVESALQELYQHLLSTQGWERGMPLANFREVDANGDVANAAGNGGLLASDTTPIYLSDAAEALCIQWAAGNSDIVAATVDIPANLDGAADITVQLLVQAAGTTNAPSFSALTSFDGGTQITDSATGTASASKQTLSITIAAADVPASAQVLTVQLVPGAHATDAWTLYGVKVIGKQSLLAA